MITNVKKYAFIWWWSTIGRVNLTPLIFKLSNIVPSSLRFINFHLSITHTVLLEKIFFENVACIVFNLIFGRIFHMRSPSLFTRQLSMHVRKNTSQIAIVLLALYTFQKPTNSLIVLKWHLLWIHSSALINL